MKTMDADMTTAAAVQMVAAHTAYCAAANLAAKVWGVHSPEAEAIRDAADRAYAVYEKAADEWHR